MEQQRSLNAISRCQYEYQIKIPRTAKCRGLAMSPTSHQRSLIERLQINWFKINSYLKVARGPELCKNNKYLFLFFTVSNSRQASESINQQRV